MLDIKKIAVEIGETAKEKGFWDKPRNMGELLMLTTSELGECLEAHRKGKWARNAYSIACLTDAKQFKAMFEGAIKDSVEDELADAVIRILDIAEYFGINIEDHIMMKMRYNKGRERLHGKAY